MKQRLNTFIFILLAVILVVNSSNIVEALSDNQKVETSEIDKKIKKVKENAFITKRGARVIRGEDAKEIHRLQVIEEKCKTYSDECKSIDIKKEPYRPAGTDNKFQIEKELTPKELRVIEEELIGVLDSIQLDKKYIEGLEFVVAPYKLNGINGFTLSQCSKDRKLKQTVVIAYSPGLMVIGSPVHRRLVKSTILHELGHAYSNNISCLEGEDVEDDYKKFYKQLDLNYEKGNLTEKWMNDPSENFAEDFRIYYSKRLRDHSFEPGDKRTTWPYLESVDDVFTNYK